MSDVEQLAGCRILVVEDDWFISNALKRLLSGHGAVLIGPVATLREALSLAEQDGFELAVIDIKLGDELAYPVADELKRQGVPFMFATGYSAQVLPARFTDVPLFEKPFEDAMVVKEAQRLCHARQLGR